MALTVAAMRCAPHPQALADAEGARLQLVRLEAQVEAARIKLGAEQQVRAAGVRPRVQQGGVWRQW